MRFNPKLTALAFAASTAFTALGAHASSVDVKVIGTITPGACVATLAGGGTVDYGKISAIQVSQIDFTKLPKKDIPFTISCDAPAQIALKVVDNRADSVVPGFETDYNFGLGTVSGAKVGTYRMLMGLNAFVADGNPVLSVRSINGGVTWEAMSSTLLKTKDLSSWSAGGDGTPIAFKNLSGAITVETTLNKGSELPLKEDVPLDGSSTLEMVYL